MGPHRQEEALDRRRKRSGLPAWFIEHYVHVISDVYIQWKGWIDLIDRLWYLFLGFHKVGVPPSIIHLLLGSFGRIFPDINPPATGGPPHPYEPTRRLSRSPCLWVTGQLRPWTPAVICRASRWSPSPRPHWRRCIERCWRMAPGWQWHLAKGYRGKAGVYTTKTRENWDEWQPKKRGEIWANM